jgi:pimeloyl-ACP methyl ester carboxylesterase
MTETYKVKGVSVEKYSPADKQDKPPVILVHGGTHAAWCWEKWAPLLAENGYEVHALNWYNHADSAKLPEDEFIKRSIVDVAHREVTYVADALGRVPIVIGHSMGGLASAVYASVNDVAKLVLIAPVMPAAPHPNPVPLPVDMTKPYPPFPFEQSREVFYTTLTDEEARPYIERLVSESPQAVSEAVGWTVELDPAKITASTLVIADELDHLIPNDALKRYADMLHAPYKEYSGVGHCDLLVKEPTWRTVATDTIAWLES